MRARVPVPATVPVLAPPSSAHRREKVSFLGSAAATSSGLLTGGGACIVSVRTRAPRKRVLGRRCAWVLSFVMFDEMLISDFSLS